MRVSHLTALRAALVAIGSLATATAAGALPIVYTADMNAANENPSNPSTGTGFAKITLDTAAHTMRVEATFTGLSGTVTAAHIHCCVAPPGNVGVATQTPTFSGFPSGVTDGSYDNTFDLTLASSWNAAFITASGGTTAAAEAALAAGIAAGQAYFNIHTTFRTGGEIRGFLVPEPGSAALLTTALLGVALFRRETRRRGATVP